MMSTIHDNKFSGPREKTVWLNTTVTTTAATTTTTTTTTATTTTIKLNNH